MHWVKPRLLWLAPLILAYFGIRALPASTWHVSADLGLLALSAAISVGLGVWRGQTTKVWRDTGGTWWRQGSARTLVLWGALIVARGLLYGLDAAATARPRAWGQSCSRWRSASQPRTPSPPGG